MRMGRAEAGNHTYFTKLRHPYRDTSGTSLGPYSWLGMRPEPCAKNYPRTFFPLGAQGDAGVRRGMESSRFQPPGTCC
jgi:hypothetical protein